jgi:hypothetical protein
LSARISGSFLPKLRNDEREQFGTAFHTLHRVPDHALSD